jgi:hypothetical protein
MEDGVVEEPGLGQPGERRRRLRGGLLIEPDRDVAAARLQDDVVGGIRVERLR